MRIPRQDWERVIEKGCDIANATETDGDPMYAVHVKAMMALLDELEAKYGPHSRIVATRADYLECLSERRALYEQALDLARKAHDVREIEEIMDSIIQLGQEERAEGDASPKGGPATRPGDSGGRRRAAIGELSVRPACCIYESNRHVDTVLRVNVRRRHHHQQGI